MREIERDRDREKKKEKETSELTPSKDEVKMWNRFAVDIYISIYIYISIQIYTWIGMWKSGYGGGGRLWSTFVIVCIGEEGGNAWEFPSLSIFQVHIFLSETGLYGSRPSPLATPSSAATCTLYFYLELHAW